MKGDLYSLKSEYINDLLDFIRKVRTNFPKVEITAVNAFQIYHNLGLIYDNCHEYVTTHKDHKKDTKNIGLRHNYQMKTLDDSIRQIIENGH